MKGFARLLLLAALTPAGAGAAESERFVVGVYLYEYQLAAAAKEEGRDYFDFLESHLKILQSHGVNGLYLGGTSVERFDEHLRLAGKFGVRLIPQLDFAYLQPDWTDEQIDVYAKTAGEFIRKYGDDPRVIAWSVREEVPHAAVARLARYYEKIREHAPGARFNMIHNSFEAARDHPPPYPAIFGTDRYAFWFEVSGGGYLASPSFALDWTRREAARYADEAERRSAHFMLVVTQGGMLMPRWANQIIASPHEADIPGDEAERMALRSRVLRYAQQGRMGWREVEGPDGRPRYNFWKYYRLPPNCTKALAWTSVLEGAKLFFVWSYAPPRSSELNLDATSSALLDPLQHEVHWMTLAGRPGKGNPQLAELAQAAQEIRPFERLIVRMRKATDSPIVCDQRGVHHRSFSLPGIDGRVVVIHNANVGQWPNDSRHMFRDEDQIIIDGDGNLLGYVPFKEPLPVRFALKNPGADARATVFDVLSGRRIPSDAGGTMTVSVLPGSAALIYVGRNDDAGKVRALLEQRTARSNRTPRPAYDQSPPG